MKFTFTRKDDSGIALMLVMIVIVALGIIAGGFAYSMKVESTLARNSSFDSEYDWIGRSGVEFARYVLAQELTVPNEGSYDALCQKWAGGPLGTNDILANLSLENVPLGSGKFTVKIIDLERRYNINAADDTALHQAMLVMGVDADQSQIVSDSILDWMDTDDNSRLSGAESDYYLSLKPPYLPKNGLIDDLTELLRVRGVTPEMYWGPKAPPRPLPPRKNERNQVHLQTVKLDDVPTYPVGLADLFTPISSRLININTASAEVLEMIPGIEPNVAQAILTTRAGPDGVDGTEDDVPFRNVGELINVPGFSVQAAQRFGRIFTTRSVTFEVTVTVDIGGRKRDLVAIVRRLDPKNIAILQSYWK